MVNLHPVAAAPPLKELPGYRAPGLHQRLHRQASINHRQLKKQLLISQLFLLSLPRVRYGTTTPRTENFIKFKLTDKLKFYQINNFTMLKK
jgi:hypothetical protein